MVISNELITEIFMRRFAIVDTANLFHRARHVVQGDIEQKCAMAIHIMFKALKKLRREMNTDHVVFVTENRSWRYEVYPQYKSSRQVAKNEMSPREIAEDAAFRMAEDMFLGFISESTRCTVLRAPGIEGDDWVARWIQIHPDDEHVILSSDSDFIQLLSENVTIYDGINDRSITTKGVFNNKGQELAFKVDGATGKLKVDLPIDAARKKAELADKKLLAEGKKAKGFNFSVGEEWWREALFVKIIRGDSGDGIFSAYPRVRYVGTSETTGIKEAWENRTEKGYIWNNFMFQKWDKLCGMDADGSPIIKKVSVKDEFARNEMLIDLTKQPEHIKAVMDEAILASLDRPRVPDTAMRFMKFCGTHDLPTLGREVRDHEAYLTEAYL